MQTDRSRSRPGSRRLPRSLVGFATIAILWSLASAAGRAQAPPAPAPPPQAGAPDKQFDVFGGGDRFAVPECSPRKGDAPSTEACRTLTQVLRNDLKFESIDLVPDNLIAAIPPLNPDAPNFVDWQGIGATMLVTMKASVTGGDITVEAKLHTVGDGKAILAKRYTGRADNPRIFAHQLSDEILALASIKGVARSKIAFVSNRDSGGKGVTKELYIMDYDGYNPRRVTVNNSINLMPAWSPDGRLLAYTSFRKPASPDLYVASVFEGKNANITNGSGQVSSAAFSPDGKRLAYAISRSGNTDIWVANADGSGARKVTSSSGLDTAPFWSPTGQEIAFTSDRGGTPQIYVMDSEGLNVRRLTTIGNWNDAPAWNPNKQFPEIAYTARIEGGFEIAVLNYETRQVRQITQGKGSCEYPSWSPSGRHLTFACGRGSKWQIGVADRDGRNVTMLPAGPGKNEQPDWGPAPQ
jgi:TolB protein